MNEVLYKRITREYDDRVYKRKPAKGSLIIEFENIINNSDNLVVEFDGYIIPVDGSKVTLLFYCREYNRELSNTLELRDLANLLFTELKKEVDFDLAEKLANKFKCSLACVFSPYDYPLNEKEVKEDKIIVFPYIEKKKVLKLMNIEKFRNLLLNHRKRTTKKPLVFASTKLEYYLAKIPLGQKTTIAFPGDADGILLDKNHNILAIFEYKSDTYGKNISEENILKYKEDVNKFRVLDDLCKMVSVPLVVIFWSDTHTKCKIIIRNSFNGKEISFILSANSYIDLASDLNNSLKNLKNFTDKLKS